MPSLAGRPRARGDWIGTTDLSNTAWSTDDQPPPSVASGTGPSASERATGGQQQTARVPAEPRRNQVPLESRILSSDELHRTPSAVYETEGHRFESCRARFLLLGLHIERSKSPGGIRSLTLVEGVRPRSGRTQHRVCLPRRSSQSLAGALLSACEHLGCALGPGNAPDAAAVRRRQRGVHRPPPLCSALRRRERNWGRRRGRRWERPSARSGSPGPGRRARPPAGRDPREPTAPFR